MLRSRAAKGIFFTAFLPLHAMSTPVDYVIHISVDGLRADAVTALGIDNAPNYYRLRTEGAFTDNARTDVGETVTLPNHTTQLTGRGVHGDSGHNYTANVIPSPKTTLHRNKGSYIKSVFDVVHDNGLSTCLYASKEKFVLYEQSYNESNSARDTIGEDNGCNKIDRYLFNEDMAVLVASYLKAMTSTPYNYCMLHLRHPDIAGHGYHWDITPGSAYLESIMRIDDLLGNILAPIDGD
jgi:predicted AlkP superfamily pyrophosphatase or phosphodiesterase